METNGDLHYLQRTPLGWDLMQFNDGTASRKATWKFDPQQCDIGPYNWQRSAKDANLAWSPDRRQVLISMPCEEGTWLYLGNLNGQLSPVLNYPLYSYTQLIQAWSPDGKSIVLDADLETPGAQHLYLLDLAIALTDPSTRPVRITQSGFDEHSPVWQPKP
jgi:Tol biopolymer transport system component